MKNFVDDNKMPRLRIDQDAEYPLLVHIDCGHGGELGGVYQTAGKQWNFGDFQIYEGVQNRAIGKLLATKFIDNHVSYCFTTISNQDESLSKRMEYVQHVVKSYPKYKHVFISIHADATNEESNANGVSIYTTTKLTESDYAANFFFKHIYDLGLRVRINRAKDNEYDQESNFYVIRKAEEFGCVAMLLELGFFTNREEAKKIMEPEFQGNAANFIYMGVVDLIAKYKQDGKLGK